MLSFWVQKKPSAIKKKEIYQLKTVQLKVLYLKMLPSFGACFIMFGLFLETP